MAFTTIRFEPLNSRVVAAQILRCVILDHRSLNTALIQLDGQVPSIQDRSFVRSLCYGTLRWYFRLDEILTHLLRKPLRNKDADIKILALLGLYQICYSRVKPHAAVSETVAAVGKKTWAKSLLNGIFRTYLRSRDKFDALADKSQQGLSAHPGWLESEFRNNWPDIADDILRANNVHPPMVLRINRQKIKRNQYLNVLSEANILAKSIEIADDALVLESPVDISRLPGFSDGLVSVQDAAAQLAAELLDLKPGQRVLDACAAPGGKTTHILQVCPALSELVAVDIDSVRALKIRQDFNRLGCSANIVVADMTKPETWWRGRAFDRILLDAPCSATGVIRRHPDIKILRHSTDIEKLCALQQCLLDVAWSMLDSGGEMLYATCSILKRENCDQINKFLEANSTARHVPLEIGWGVEQPLGWQILPGDRDTDGFYYAKLKKH